MEGCIIFINGDAAVTLIHLILSSFSFFFPIAAFPFHFFLSPGLSAGERWQEPTEVEPPGVQPGVWGSVLDQQHHTPSWPGMLWAVGRAGSRLSPRGSFLWSLSG